MSVKRSLSYAHGYLELGMVAEAAAELERIAAPDNELLDVLTLRLIVLQEQKKWPAVAEVGEQIVRRRPTDPSIWITWAYATRRSVSLAAAEKILLEAVEHHPNEPTVHFNLACYACQRGDLKTARMRADRAVALNPKFAGAVETDEDLAPLRAADATDCQPAP